MDGEAEHLSVLPEEPPAPTLYHLGHASATRHLQTNGGYVGPQLPGGTLVLPGAGTLQSAIDAASAGDVLYLASGTYTSSGQAVATINKDITLRAVIAGHAVLDGEDQRRVISISSGMVVLEGLGITRGYSSGYEVCARFLNFP